MLQPTIDVPVPADTWVPAVTGPVAEFCATGNYRFFYRYGPTESMPETPLRVAHSRKEGEELVSPLPAGMTVWVYSPGVAMELALTVRLED